MTTKLSNRDLVWSLSGFTYPETAVNFLKRFEKSFCIFSSSVKQLYSNYELRRCSDYSKNVVTLPNPYAYHDTFYNIPEEAVIPTGMVISPGEAGDHDNWLLCVRSKQTGKWSAVDLKKGLEKINKLYPNDEPFLPVILNTDLKKSSINQQPVMHLHRISLKKLGELSPLQRNDICKAVYEKISSIAA